MHYPNIRRLRIRKEITQEQIADALNMHRTTYSRYENGDREIPLSTAMSLAKYYNVSLDYIAGLILEERPLK